MNCDQAEEAQRAKGYRSRALSGGTGSAAKWRRNDSVADPPHAGTRPVTDSHALRRSDHPHLGEIDLLGRTVTFGRAKTASGTGRVIPINDELARSPAAHRA